MTTILKEKYHVSKTPGNSNSQIGVPLALLNHTDGTEDFLVVEMGMNEPGQIAKLVQCAPPDIAILTQVALTHAGNFSSLRDIAFEKAEIFNHPKTKLGIVNQDIDYFSEVLNFGNCAKISFSSRFKHADFYLEKDVVQAGNEVFKFDKQAHPFFGNHHYENLTAAIACARQLNVSFEEIRQAESKLLLPERRFEIIEKQGITFVNDSYNASEISIKAALESLPKQKNGGKQVAVIGEMLELGKFSSECHKNVGEKALEHVDSMFLLGSLCSPIYDCWKEKKKPVELFLERSQLVKSLKANLNAGDVVLLKGSCSNQLWKILEEF